MARVMRTATEAQVEAVERAERLLRSALLALGDADCPRTADRVRAALRSCGGARRHAGHRLARTAAGTTGGAAGA